MRIKPRLREHPGWEFGNNRSAGSHFNRLKAICRRCAVGHLRSPWPGKAMLSVRGVRPWWQHRNLLSHDRLPRLCSVACQEISCVCRVFIAYPERRRRSFQSCRQRSAPSPYRETRQPLYQRSSYSKVCRDIRLKVLLDSVHFCAFAVPIYPFRGPAEADAEPRHISDGWADQPRSVRGFSFTGRGTDQYVRRTVVVVCCGAASGLLV